MNRLTLLSMLAIVVLGVAIVLIWVMGEQDRDEIAQNTAAPAEATAPQTEASGLGPELASSAPSAAPSEKPTFDVVRVNPSGDTVIAGRAGPGDKVTVLDGGVAIGSVEADDNGEWVFLPSGSLDPGEHKLSLESRSSENGKSVASDREVVLVVPEVAKDVAGQPVDAPAGALAVEVPASGDGGVRVLNLPGIADLGQTTTNLAIEAVDYGTEGLAAFSGKGPADGRLIAYLNNQPITEVVVEHNGRWIVEGASPVGPGPHRFRMDHVDAGGKVLARAEIVFELIGPQALTEIAGNEERDVLVVQPGQNLWLLARRTYGAGMRYTIIFEANKNQIADPDLIFPGQVLQLPPG